MLGYHALDVGILSLFAAVAVDEGVGEDAEKPGAAVRVLFV